MMLLMAACDVKAMMDDILLQFFEHISPLDVPAIIGYSYNLSLRLYSLTESDICISTVGAKLSLAGPQ